MVYLEIKELGISLNILNVYGPYLDKKPHWENFVENRASSDPFTLIGGNLNLTLLI